MTTKDIPLILVFKLLPKEFAIGTTIFFIFNRLMTYSIDIFQEFERRITKQIVVIALEIVIFRIYPVEMTTNIDACTFGSSFKGYVSIKNFLRRQFQ